MENKVSSKEEALEALEVIGNMVIHKNEHEIYRIKHLEHFDTIKQALSDKDTLGKMYTEGVRVNENLQSKLNAIDKWILNELGRNDISSCIPVSEDLNPYHCTKLRELHQIIEGESK